MQKIIIRLVCSSILLNSNNFYSLKSTNIVVYLISSNIIGVKFSLSTTIPSWFGANCSQFAQIGASWIKLKLVGAIRSELDPVGAFWNQLELQEPDGLSRRKFEPFGAI